MPKAWPLSGAKILIAEDNAIQAYDLSCLLKAAGAEVVGPLRTVTEALAVARSASLTCAVLDVVLRGEEVFPVAQALRERGIGVIYVTGSSDLPRLRRDWPETQVISKPASAGLLLQALCHAMPQQ